MGRIRVELLMGRAGASLLSFSGISSAGFMVVLFSFASNLIQLPRRGIRNVAVCWLSMKEEGKLLSCLLCTLITGFCIKTKAWKV